jgi:hypothetical protein
MARLIPSAFPYESDTSAWAEKTFYDSCRDHLTDDWLVLYSQRFVGKRSSLGQRQGLGEIDFLLLHKTFGIVAVEVKGGQIDIYEGQWFSSNSKGRFSIKNPFEQAEEGSEVILAKLKHELPGLRLNNCVRHCVVFPAVSGRTLGSISTYGPREIIIFKEDLASLTTKIEQVVTHWGQKPRWNDADLKSIKNVLIPTTKTPGVSYVEYINILRELDGLTDSQLRTIRQLTKDRGRSVVTGGAGTGKTVLGMARAQQLAIEGKKVLYICANSSLSQHLQTEIEALGNPITENLTVETASAFITREGRAGTSGEKFELRKKNFPSRSDRFLNAIQEAGAEESIDCLVVDEAQDVSKNDLDLIEFLVKSPQNGGSIIILGDPNQQLLLGRIESALGAEEQRQSHSLDVNCRNTREIASIAHSFTDQRIDTLESICGIKVRKARLRGSLSEQVFNEIEYIRREYDPARIVVLTLNGIADLDNQDSFFIDGQRWESRTRAQEGVLPKQILVYSARSFQGREADAVIVALTEKSLLRTFPFRRFASEAMKNRKVVARPQALVDLQRVEEMFERYRELGIRKQVAVFEQELNASGSGLSENKKTFLVREFKRASEMEFEPRFNDPILNELWKQRQKHSLKVSLYSMMTRSRVILSLVGDKQAINFIDNELNSSADDVELYLRDI